MKKSLLAAMCTLAACLISVSASAASIISTRTTKGLIDIMSTAPANVGENQYVGDIDPNIDILRIFKEQSVFMLEQDVPVDIDTSKFSTFPVTFSGGSTEPPPSAGGTLAAGTYVDSFFFHLDEPSNELGRVEGSVAFNVDILGVVTDSDTLFDTHSLLGATGTIYSSTAGNHGTLEASGEYIRFTNLCTLEFQVDQQSGMDQFRVITAFPAATGILSTFNSSSEGWMIKDPEPTSHFGSQAISNTTLPWIDTVGQPPGSVLAEDIHGFTWDWISAPSSFLGDRSAEYCRDISFDILLGTFPSPPDGLGYAPAVALQGLTKTLFYNMPPTIRNVWATRTVPLTEAGWVVDDYVSGAAATQVDMLAVLANLQGLYILTDWRVGNDSTHVDNVRLGNPPSLDDFPWEIFMPAIIHGKYTQQPVPP